MVLKGHFISLEILFRKSNSVAEFMQALSEGMFGLIFLQQKHKTKFTMNQLPAKVDWKKADSFN